ncbi:MAG TPA: NAD(+)/NADH kinase [Bacteroidales bacterium]|nr:NAD(+)/NADH kinase [Bacteroidales bacterium]
MLNRVAIFSKDSTAKTREGVGKLVDELHARGIEMLMHKRNGDFNVSTNVPLEYFTDLTQIKSLPDLIFSVGGDGTFLETTIKVKDLGIPIAGVNTGRMGFLANIHANEIGPSIDLLQRNDFVVVERCLLSLESPRGLFEGNNSYALNEITIQKSDLSMITIHVYVNDTYLNTYWSDGLIISTATGSTAYNLSAGGPILTPDDESIIISPIAPHNLTIRPIVISGESRLKMIAEGRSREYMTTVDFRSIKIPFGEEIQISRAPEKIKTIMLKNRDFYSTLRNKLMWGADSRN